MPKIPRGPTEADWVELRKLARIPSDRGHQLAFQAALHDAVHFAHFGGVTIWFGRPRAKHIERLNRMAELAGDLHTCLVDAEPTVRVALRLHRTSQVPMAAELVDFQHAAKSAAADFKAFGASGAPRTARAIHVERFMNLIAHAVEVAGGGHLRFDKNSRSGDRVAFFKRLQRYLPRGFPPPKAYRHWPRRRQATGQ